MNEIPSYLSTRSQWPSIMASVTDCGVREPRLDSKTHRFGSLHSPRVIQSVAELLPTIKLTQFAAGVSDIVFSLVQSYYDCMLCIGILKSKQAVAAKCVA